MGKRRQWGLIGPASVSTPPPTNQSPPYLHCHTFLRVTLYQTYCPDRHNSLCARNLRASPASSSLRSWCTGNSRCFRLWRSCRSSPRPSSIP